MFNYFLFIIFKNSNIVIFDQLLIQKFIIKNDFL